MMKWPPYIWVYRCDPCHCMDCPLKDGCTKVPEKGRTVRRHELEDYIINHRERMETEEAREFYKRRSSSVERIFADMKEHRAGGRFSGRGLERAKTQVALTLLVHNLVTLSNLMKHQNGKSVAENAAKTAA